jgi:alcohol dehydrogenase (cytochrome c)
MRKFPKPLSDAFGRAWHRLMRLSLLAYPALSLLLSMPAWGESLNLTADQVALGKAIFAARCATCHGPALEGAAGPALEGVGFLARWESGRRTARDLLNSITGTMPLGVPRSLTAHQYTAVTAFILARNGHQATDIPLSAANADVLLSANSVPASSAASAPAPRPSLPASPDTVLPATTLKPDDAELERADDSDWLMYNKDFAGRRYSTLDQITRDNAQHLRPVCLFQAGEIGSFEAAPVVYNGMMYITTPYNTFALDPRNCRKQWEHRYADVDQSLPMVLSRGAALYRGKLFRVTPNGHLLALDAATGKLLWDVWLADKDRGYWLSAAPVAYGGKVFIGTAGADWGANGFIYAFDAGTGRLVWHFNVIPTGKEIGADTWKKGSETGGGSFWSTFSLDRQQGLLFASIGNPAPDYNGAMRPGDNLFTDSVVALNLNSGKIAWWVQQSPHDIHDWDTAAAPTLYEQNGHKYMSVASKDGWLYIYDRDTHKLLAKTEISQHTNVDVPLGTEGVYHCPGISGGAAWNGAAYSPAAKALFVNSLDWCGTTRLTEDRYVEGSSYFSGEHTWDPPEKARGFTHAVDAASGKLLWLRNSNTPMLAALTPTAGGVLFTGDLDGNFLVLATDSGKTLYAFNTGGAVAGAPSTYLVGGKQYVAMASGNSSRTHWGTTGSMTLVVFALGGS